MKGRPRSSPSSKTVTMLGCCSRAAALASISKRRRLSSSRRALDGEGLDRDLALEGLVAAAVDHAHAALADAAGDRVLADAPRAVPVPAARLTRRGWAHRGRRGIVLELQEEDGDVVLAAVGVGLVDQRAAPPCSMSPARLAHHARDLVVRDHRGEAVRAQQQDVARLASRAPACPPAGRRLPPRARVTTLRSGWVRACSAEIDPALDLLVHPGVVARELAQARRRGSGRRGCRPRGPGWPMLAVHQHRRHGGGHALVLACCSRGRLQHLLVGEAHGGLEPVAVVGDGLVEAEGPGDLLVAAGQARRTR